MCAGRIWRFGLKQEWRFLYQHQREEQRRIRLWCVLIIVRISHVPSSPWTHTLDAIYDTHTHSRISTSQTSNITHHLWTHSALQVQPWWLTSSQICCCFAPFSANVGWWCQRFSCYDVISFTAAVNEYQMMYSMCTQHAWVWAGRN